MRKRNISAIGLIVFSLSLMLSACGEKESEPAVEKSEQTSQTDDKEEETGELFGQFESETLDGEKVTNEVFKNSELTMVNIWGTFCGPCIEEMPGLGELSREYEKDGSKVQIVGIISDVNQTGDETAQEIITKTKADYTHLIVSDDLYEVLRSVSVVPTTVFVDSEGKQVGEVYAGARDKDGWNEVVQELLSEVQS